MDEKRKIELGEETSNAIEELFVDVEEYKQAITEAREEIDLADMELQDLLDDFLHKNTESKQITNSARRISKLTVGKLFGIYNYEIDISNQYNILHSVNGRGKTTILKLIKATIEFDLFILDMTPFEFFYIRFSDGKEIRITKKDLEYSYIRDVLFKRSRNRWIQSEDFPRRMDTSITPKHEESTVNLSIELVNKSEEDCIIIDYEKEPDFADTITRVYRRFFNRQEIKRIEPEDCKDQIYTELSRTAAWEAVHQKIEKFTDGLNCTFIEANRIKASRIISSREDNMYSRYNATDEHIEECAFKLLDSIKFTRMQYLKKTDQLNMTFPQRAVEAMAGKDNKFSQEYLLKQMDDLDIKRGEYEKYGLLPKDNDTVRETIRKNLPKECSQDMLAMLDVYIEDYLQRLQTAEKLYNDIQLFLRIINIEHKFTDKKMIIGPSDEDGRQRDFVFFRGDNGSDIRLRQLSSGEKNDFILFSEMIFGSDRNTLLLMDEPEISTHISWQMMFSREVAEICEQTGMQVLVATHSPNIVRGYEDHVILLDEVE